MRAALLGALALIAASCGADSGDEATDETTTTTTQGPAKTTTTTIQAPAGTTTTERAVEPIPVLDAHDIPDLIVAWGNGDGEPLQLAQDIIGFPIAVPTPEGTEAYSVSVDLDGRVPDLPWRWEWSYEATTDEPIPEIDVKAEQLGPGAIALSEEYGPILAELGWRHTGSTGSDPSSGAGGPQSVNHVYTFDDDTFLLGEIDATAKPLFVWTHEELIFGTGIPGYRIDVTLEAQNNFIPVPMVEALFPEVPIAPGARLTGLTLRSRNRAADSFDADEGLRYLDIEYTCELLPDSANAAYAVYSTGLEGSIYQPGTESFFEPGFIEFEEPTINGDRWTQRVIVLDRYPGEIFVDVDPDTGEVSSVVRITLEPNREVLQPLPE